VTLERAQASFDNISRSFSAPNVIEVILYRKQRKGDGMVSLMIGWFASNGYEADITVPRRDYPGLVIIEEWSTKKSPFAGAK
jgi:hypothetical protein